MNIRLIKTTTKTEIFLVESESCDEAIEALTQGKYLETDRETNTAIEIAAYEALEPIFSDDEKK